MSTKIAAVMFPGSTRSYDYIAPFPIHVGMKVVVETRRGEAVVEVVEVKERSDKATASLLRVEAQF